MQKIEPMNSDAAAPLTDAPAPWTLNGRGYICMLRAPQALLDDGRFLQDSLKGRRGASGYCYLMLVDYSDSPVGPYHELLLIPGTFPFEDGRRHLSISRIFVSSLDSVVNGRRNWGIPKELAQFELHYGDNRFDRARVSLNGRCFAELDFVSWPVALPFTTAILPKQWTTLGQHWEGRSYLYRPTAHGWVRPASLRHARFDAELFPDLAQARPVLTVGVSHFQMIFHPARIQPIAADQADTPGVVA